MPVHEGLNCDEKVDYCDVARFPKHECSAGLVSTVGICKKDDENAPWYKCDCDSTGYEGFNCEIKRDYCTEEEQCNFNGFCVNLDAGVDYRVVLRKLTNLIGFENELVGANINSRDLK